MLEPLLMMLLSKDPTIQKALQHVGQQANPIRVVSPEEVTELYKRINEVPSKGMIGFRLPDDPVAYINSDSKQYQKAGKDPISRMLLAGSIVHERAHNTEDEPGARQQEAEFLRDNLKKIPLSERANMKMRIGAMETLAAPTKVGKR